MPLLDNNDVVSRGGFPGSIADVGYPAVVDSVTNAGAVDIVAGTAVAQQSGGAITDGDVPSVANTKFLGFAIIDPGLERSPTQRIDASGNFAYQPGDVMNVSPKGRYWVLTEAAVTEGATVYYRQAADGGNTDIGYVADAAGTGLIEIPGSTFRSSTSAAGVAYVEI